MRILAAITQAGVARRILACLALPARAPTIAPGRPLPESTAAATLETVVPRPDAFDLDQSVPGDWGFDA
jgi:hypothetical protein